ncbi:MAG: hypothetical protein ABII79_02860 [bacterium]
MKKLILTALLITIVASVAIAEDYDRSAGNVVYVVHAVDTESDSLDEFSFNQELLLANYNSGGIISTVFDSTWRNAHVDSYGRPTRITWFLMTHEAHCRSTQGCNAIPEVMLGNFADQIDRWGDEIGWHYHHSDWVNNEWQSLNTFDGTIYRQQPDTELAVDQLAMWVLENGFFPESFRAGWTWENTDFSNWLERLIVYDFSNYWSNVPAGKNQWDPYHPSAEDYRAEGTMRRWIAKCKPGGLTQADVDDAFQLAQTEGRAVLSFYSHSYFAPTIHSDQGVVEGWLQNASQLYGVPFRYVGAKEAMQLWAGETDIIPPEITTLIINRILHVETNEDLQGPPFLALRHADGSHSGHFMSPTGQYQWDYILSDSTVTIAAVALTDLAGNQNTSEELTYFDMCTVPNPECGDVDGNGWSKLPDDLVFLVAYLFQGGHAPCDLNTADMDGSGAINVGDLMRLVGYLFIGGPPPACP